MSDLICLHRGFQAHGFTGYEKGPMVIWFQRIKCMCVLKGMGSNVNNNNKEALHLYVADKYNLIGSPYAHISFF